ncbi:MAG: carboxypeptidase-like regulatory domain-containing protein, partial [Prolixibacteraceae bacterium]|nr:carboxypeptidase-like regulatory domain-containing protein [Prolixibacteraceae bacterium]
EPSMAAVAKIPETNQLAEKAGEAVPTNDTQIRIRGVATFRSTNTQKDSGIMRFVQTSDLIESGQKTVRGKVISQDDSLPLAGATIVEKGSLNGTVSDMDGNFSLQLTNETDSTLVASFVGMQNAEFNPSGDSLVVVALQPSEMAQNEMVVIGYGTIGENKNEQTNQYAQPVGGMDNFEKYVKENAILPENYPSKRAVVKVKLHLNSGGKIIKIVNINNSGQELFEKTKQIILNGPDWVPEIKNGKNVESETELRIVFKKAK